MKIKVIHDYYKHESYEFNEDTETVYYIEDTPDERKKLVLEFQDYTDPHNWDIDKQKAEDFVNGKTNYLKLQEHVSQDYLWVRTFEDSLKELQKNYEYELKDLYENFEAVSE